MYSITAFVPSSKVIRKSTEKLSDVLLDRFDLIYMHYPENLGVEKEIVTKNGKKIQIS